MTSMKTPLVSYESVSKAYRDILSRGNRPSVRKVMDYLGGGSPNDIALYLKQLKSMPENRTVPGIILDSRIAQLIEDQARRAAADACAELEIQLTDIQADADELAKAGQQAELLIAELQRQLEDSNKLTQLLQGRTDQLMADKEKAEQQLLNEGREREKLMLELSRAEVRLESLKTLEMEMKSLESKYQGEHEARINAEISRAALEAKLEGIIEERTGKR